MHRFRVSTFDGKMQLSLKDVQRPEGLSPQERTEKVLRELASDIEHLLNNQACSRLVPLHFDAQWEKILRALDCIIHILQHADAAFQMEGGGSRASLSPWMPDSMSLRVVVHALVDIVVRRCVDGPNLLYERCKGLLSDYLHQYAVPGVFGDCGALPETGEDSSAVPERKSSVPAVQPPLPDSLSAKLISWWRRHKLFSELLRQLCVGVDKNAVSGHSLKWSLSALAAEAWCTQIFHRVEAQCRSRILVEIRQNRNDGVVRSAEPLEELTEMFKVAALWSATQKNPNMDEQLSSEEGSEGSDRTTVPSGFHQIQYLVDPDCVAARYQYVVPNQIRLLPVRGMYGIASGGLNSKAQPQVSKHEPKQRTFDAAAVTTGPKSTYVTSLERPFLMESRTFFSLQSPAWLSSPENSLAVYIKHVDLALRNETARAKLYFMPHTERRLRDIILEVTVLGPQARGTLYSTPDLVAAFEEVQGCDAPTGGAVPSAAPASLIASESAPTLVILYRILKELQTAMGEGRIVHVPTLADLAKVGPQEQSPTNQSARTAEKSPRCTANHSMVAIDHVEDSVKCASCSEIDALWFCATCDLTLCVDCGQKSSRSDDHAAHPVTDSGTRQQHDAARHSSDSLDDAGPTDSASVERGSNPQPNIENDMLSSTEWRILVGLRPLRTQFFEFCVSVLKTHVDMYIRQRRDNLPGSSGLNPTATPPRGLHTQLQSFDSVDGSPSTGPFKVSTLQQRQSMRCSLVNAVLDAESQLLPVVTAMGSDALMKRELDRAISRTINISTFHKDIGGSFSVALATFVDQLLRGRTFRHGIEETLLEELDRNDLLPRVCYLAHAVKDKDVLRTHLEYNTMARYLSSERHITLMLGCETTFLKLLGAAISSVFVQTLWTMFHDIFSESARLAARKFGDFLSNPPPPLTEAEKVKLAKLTGIDSAVSAASTKSLSIEPCTGTTQSNRGATTEGGRREGGAGTTPIVAQSESGAGMATEESQNESGAGMATGTVRPDSGAGTAAEVASTSSSNETVACAGAESASPRSRASQESEGNPSTATTPITPQQRAVLDGIEAAFLRAEDEHARAVCQQQLSARARLRRRLSEKQQQSRSRRGSGTKSNADGPSDLDSSVDSSMDSPDQDPAVVTPTQKSKPAPIVQKQHTLSCPDEDAQPLSLDSAPPLPPDFATDASISASILSSVWPHHNVASPRRLPPVLQFCYEKFQEYTQRQMLQGAYSSQRVMRVHWVQTRVVVCAKFPKVNDKFKLCEFHVNALQATLLSVFTKNRKTGVTFADIAATFGFKFSQNNGFELEAEAALVFAVLDSLLDPAKYPPQVTGGALLMKMSGSYSGLNGANTATGTPAMPPSPVLLPLDNVGSIAGFPLQLTDKFKLNRNFRSRVKKIVLSEPLALKQFQELMVTAAVKRLRTLTVRAAVMQIMKQKKEAMHRDIATALPSYIAQFKVSSRALRVALTHLIDLRYIRRDDNNPEQYIYCPDDGVSSEVTIDELKPLDGGSVNSTPVRSIASLHEVDQTN